MLASTNRGGGGRGYHLMGVVSVLQDKVPDLFYNNVNILNAAELNTFCVCVWGVP